MKICFSCGNFLDIFRIYTKNIGLITHCIYLQLENGQNHKNNMPIFIFYLVNLKHFLVVCGLEKSPDKNSWAFFFKMLLISAFHSTEDDIQWKTANPWLCVERHSEQYDPWVRKIPWRRQPTPVFLPGKFHGQRSLVGYSPWGRKESNISEWLTSSLLSGQGHVKGPVKRWTYWNSNMFYFCYISWNVLGKFGNWLSIQVSWLVPQAS